MKPELLSMMAQLLDYVLQQRPNADALLRPPDLMTADLIGETSILTSLELVSFIADVEAVLRERYDLRAALVSEKSLWRKRSPFRSLDALADFVLELWHNDREVAIS